MNDFLISLCFPDDITLVEYALEKAKFKALSAKYERLKAVSEARQKDPIMAKIYVRHGQLSNFEKAWHKNPDLFI